MAPMLRQAWNRKELHWHELVAAEMHFPTTMPAAIREKWEQNQAIAAANRVTLTPVEFAYTFVDQSFNP